jgi:hypothetical protein
MLQDKKDQAKRLQDRHIKEMKQQRKEAPMPIGFIKKA